MPARRGSARRRSRAARRAPRLCRRTACGTAGTCTVGHVRHTSNAAATQGTHTTLIHATHTCTMSNGAALIRESHMRIARTTQRSSSERAHDGHEAHAYGKCKSPMGGHAHIARRAPLEQRAHDGHEAHQDAVGATRRCLHWRPLDHSVQHQRAQRQQRLRVVVPAFG